MITSVVVDLACRIHLSMDEYSRSTWTYLFMITDRLHALVFLPLTPELGDVRHVPVSITCANSTYSVMISDVPVYNNERLAY